MSTIVDCESHPFCLNVASTVGNVQVIPSSRCGGSTV